MCFAPADPGRVGGPGVVGAIVIALAVCLPLEIAAVVWLLHVGGAW